MNENDDELEPGVIVGSPQAGAAAGGSATSGNVEDDESPLEDPDNEGTEGDDGDDSGEGDESDGDTPLVAKLRGQAAKYRRKLRDAETERDTLARELWTERVSSLELLADPTDLEFDAEALADSDKIRELADALLTRKPHLRSRKIRARAGQGEGSTEGDVNLAALLRRGA